MGRFQWLEFDDPATKSGTPAPAGPELESGEDFTNPERVLRLADEAYRRLDYERALRLFSKVLTLDPNLEPGWAGQLKCLLDLNEIPEALTWAIKAQKLFPKSAEIIASRACALARQGNLSEAIAFSDGAMKAGLIGWYPWVVRGEILAASNSANAEFCMMKARELAPKEWLVALKTAQAYARTPQEEKAVEFYKVVLSERADLAEAWYELGQLQVRIGLTSAAIVSLQTCVKLVPDRKKYSDALGQALRVNPLETLWRWVKRLLKGVWRS
ncbi:MAG TPA: tetratricopeptide repeat protein [Candidatus Ozemobacteraceae bacterium]|nr:tetratricopeptide repeat protein [Candidatus Ozemobacteraceae bacterium]